MKKQKRKAKRPAKKQANVSVQAAPEDASDKSSRRDVLRKIRNGGLLAVVAGGGGWYLIQDVRATIREHDLTQIGNGIPAVVQIHDPNCPRCLALQGETRDAMASFEDGELQYLIADISRSEGRQLAAAHNVNHVTLLLFDAEGNRRDVLVGERTSDDLEEAFRRHVARSSAN
ncbi:MAG: hypothetical protein AAF563_19705 [Pseudomonadota bacterium]